MLLNMKPVKDEHDQELPDGEAAGAGLPRRMSVYGVCAREISERQELLVDESRSFDQVREEAVPLLKNVREYGNSRSWLALQSARLQSISFDMT